MSNACRGLRTNISEIKFHNSQGKASIKFFWSFVRSGSSEASNEKASANDPAIGTSYLPVLA